MKNIIPFLLLLCPMGLWAQTADQTVDSIMNYLEESHVIKEGYVVWESNGRNYATRGEFIIDCSTSGRLPLGDEGDAWLVQEGKNGPMMPTSKLVRGLWPLLDQLPHLRRMTDERTGEVLEGRIAMRLKPEAGDTSAYFLLTYDRTRLTFKYGVNSPGSISLAKSPANGPGVGFRNRELSAAEAAPIIGLFDEYSRRADARVVDTLFRYDGDRDYEWCTGERRPTKARVVLLPAPTESEIQQWANLFFLRYKRHDEVTISLRNSFREERVYLVSVSGSFTTDGAFHLYLVGRYRDRLCLIRVVARPGEPCEVVPGFARLIDHLMGTEQPEPPCTGTPTKLIALMEKEMARRQSLPDAETLDTLFVSNDHEGHIWWTGMNHRCPTRAHLVRTPSSEADFAALHERILQSVAPSVSHHAWLDDGDDRRIFLSWTDERGDLHAYVLYYIIATRQLVIERADGLDPGDICIPHYRQGWFGRR